MTASCAERDDAEPTDRAKSVALHFVDPRGGSDPKRPVDLGFHLVTLPVCDSEDRSEQDTKQTWRILNGDGSTSRIGDARGHSQGFIETAAFKYLEDNLEADKVRLTPQDLKRIDEVAPRGVAAASVIPRP